MRSPSRSVIEKAFGSGRKHRIFRTLVFLAVLLPTAAIMAIALVQLEDALQQREAAKRQTIAERDKLFARAIAHGISIYIESAKETVELAAREAGKRPQTFEAQRELITEVVDGTSAFFAASIGDAAGRGIVTYDPTVKSESDRYRSGYDLSGRDYYLKMLESHGTVVSDALTAITVPRPTIAISAPYFDEDGRMLGFFAAGVNLDPLYRLALTELGNEPATPVVIDRSGQTIVHPIPSYVAEHRKLDALEPARLALLGGEGFLEEFVDVDGKTRSAAYAPVPGLGWAVWIVQEPQAPAEAFVHGGLTKAAAAFGAILLLTFALAFVLWRLIRTLHAMHQKERAFLESIGDGVIAVDRAWKIILWNRTATRLTGWTEQETLGRPFRDHVRFIRERDRKENLAFIEEAMLFGEIRPMTNSTILVARDGREIPISDSAAPLFDEDGAVDGVIIIFRDATREKDAAMLRTDFAYASHQLRTPVNKAMWDLELAMDEVKDPATRAKLQVAYHAISDVQKLSSRLIDVSQIDQKQLVPSYEESKVSEIVKDVVDAVRPDADRRKAQVLAKPPRPDLKIDTDPKLLRAALRELADNAVLYGSGSPVEIVVQEEKLDLVFQVMDRGIGISDEQKPLVFTKFFRGQNIPQDAHGAGLGLFIARSYVQLLGGKIWFDSRLGFGTTFTISVPRVRGMRE